MRLPPFLPHRKGLWLADSAVTEAAVTFQFFVARRTARSPFCQRRAHRILSRNDRTIGGLAWSGTAVRLQVRVRRLACRVATCPQRIFAERLPQLVGRYARRTHRRRDALHPIGLAPALGLPAGRTTLLGLIRSVFPQSQVVILCLAGRQGQGSQN